MRPSTRRVAALVLVGLIAVAACGGDDGDDEGGGDGQTTTRVDDGGATTETGETGGDGEDAGSTTTTTGPGEATTEPGATTTSTAPSTAGEGQEGTGAPDEEATGVDWSLGATAYRGRNGERIAFLCPPDGELGNPVWGTGTYTDDSSVCPAAVHAGVINPVEGGRVVIEMAPGQDSYQGSEANGVTSQDFDTWGGSFTFPVG